MNPYFQFTLYVGDLNPDTTEQDLYNLFCKVGTILSIRVCKDKITGKSMRYAYVNFKYHHEAKAALHSLNFAVLKGCPIRIMWSQRNPGLRKSNVGNLFVKNLPKEIENRTLYDVFSVYGRISSCKVVSNDRTLMRYGYVHFYDKISAENALDLLDGIIWNNKRITVCAFKSKSERNPKREEKATKMDRKYNIRPDQCVLDLPNDDIGVPSLTPIMFKQNEGNDSISPLIENIPAERLTKMQVGNDSISNINLSTYNPVNNNLIDGQNFDRTSTLVPEVLWTNLFDLPSNTADQPTFPCIEHFVYIGVLVPRVHLYIYIYKIWQAVQSGPVYYSY